MHQYKLAVINLLFFAALGFGCQKSDVNDYRVELAISTMPDNATEAYDSIFSMLNNALPELDFEVNPIEFKALDLHGGSNRKDACAIISLNHNGEKYSDTIKYYGYGQDPSIENAILNNIGEVKFSYSPNVVDVINKLLFVNNSCLRLYDLTSPKLKNKSFKRKLAYLDVLETCKLRSEGVINFQGANPLVDHNECDFKKLTRALDSVGMDVGHLKYRLIKKNENLLKQVLEYSPLTCPEMKAIKGKNPYKARMDSLTKITGGEVEFDFVEFRGGDSSGKVDFVYEINDLRHLAEIDTTKSYDEQLDWSLTKHIRKLNTGSKICLIAANLNAYSIGYLTDDQISYIKSLDNEISILQY